MSTPSSAGSSPSAGASGASGRAERAARGVLAPVGLGASLVLLWLFLWGDASVANLVSGIGVSAVLLLVFPQARPEGQAHHIVRPVPLARLALYFVYELLTSNLLITREILSRHTRIRTGVVACPLVTTSDGIVTVLANMLALSPGTMMVEVLDGPPTIYVHVLLLHDVGHARRQVAKLEGLIIGAFGSAEALDAVEARRAREQAGP